MKELVESEVNIINNLLRQNKIMAKVVKAENVLTSFIRYQLRLHTTESFSSVEKVLRELTVSVNRNRERFNALNTEILPVSKPFFALEVSHPEPKSLLVTNKTITDLEPDEMLLGVSALNNKIDVLKLQDTPHTLIAGITGAGKSKLLQMMLLSLIANTSPNDLEFVLIDLKNEDLVPFKNLPHVKFFAGSKDKALQVINYVLQEKEERIEKGIHGKKRLVLVIDEIAQLANSKIVRDMIGDLTSIGRSKWIHVIACTTNVTKEGGIGVMMKANFTCRLVGKVAPGLSAIATGLPHMFAHYLPGKGSFLRIEGINNHRFQTYYITDHNVECLVKSISKQYKLHNSKVVLSGSETGSSNKNHQFYTSNNEIQQKTGSFPIGQCRELTDTEVAEIHRLSNLPEFQYSGKLSLNKLVTYVFGFKNPDALLQLKSVLE